MTANNRGKCKTSIPAHARSKVMEKVCRRSFYGVAGSNLAGGMDVSLVTVVCQVEVSATG